MAKLLKRNEVPVNETWDLTALYETREACIKELDECVNDALSFEKNYKGKLNDDAVIKKAVNDYNKLLAKVYKASSYASLDTTTDMTNEEAIKLEQLAQIKLAKVTMALNFYRSELISLPIERIERLTAALPEAKVYFEDLLRIKPYMLSEEAEAVFAAMNRIGELPYQGYETTKHADMVFNEFTVNGKTYPLSFVKFENEYEYELNTEVRRAAFAEFSKCLGNYLNTIGNYYIAQVSKEKAISDFRGYKSVFDYLLVPQNVSKELYDRQIDVIMEKLSPVMRKYAKLIKRVHGLDKMTFADLKIPLDPGFNPTVTIDESKEYVEKGLSVMGKEYVELVMKAYPERWVDFAQNIGKATGGFCSSPYGYHSYILLSWAGLLSDVFTLVHELGHAAHFTYANEKQSIVNTEISSYLVEAPSTMNELLLGNYLFTKSEDARFKRWVYASIVANTYYHNMVTHLLEAAYQREVYKKVDAGEAIGVNELSAIKRSVLEAFWGDDVEIIDGAELTWMRQPHYYMGLYSYTYSAGLTIATCVSKRILNEGEAAIEDWKKVLCAGGTLSPLEFAREAGVDISTDKPLLDTIAHIEYMVDEMIRLTDELEAK